MNSHRVAFRMIWTFCQNKKSFYQTLEVTPEASQEQIKAQYYELARKFHPDKNIKHAQHFKAINEAYDILKDEAKRKEYDFSISANTQYKEKSYNQNYEHRNYHYGQTIRKNEPNKRTYSEKNPFSDGKSYFDGKDFAHEFKKQDQEKQKKKRAELTKPVESVLKIGGVVLFSVFIVEMLIGVYNFNRKKGRTGEL